MPKYTLNGKNYNIPDSLTQKFESQNPNATIAYSANGKNYNIPVNKRDAFLKAFPDAKFSEVEATQPQQQPNNQAKSGQTAEQPQKPTKQVPYKPTWQEQWGMGITMNQAEDAAMNATRPIDQRQRNAETYKQKVLGQNPELGRMGRVVEDEGSYITQEGSRHNVLVDANQRQLAYDTSFNLAHMDARFNELLQERERLQGELEKASEQWVDADGNVHQTRGKDNKKYDELVAQYQRNEDALRQLSGNEQFMQFREDQAQRSLADINQQEGLLAERREKAEKDKSFISKFFDFMSNVTHPLSAFGILPTEQEIKEGIGAYGKELQEIAKEENLLGHRRDLVQEGIDLMNEIRTEQRGGFGNLGLVTAGRNVWNEATKKGTWDGGFGELDRNMAIMQAVIKMDNGQQLSPNEQALLNDWAFNSAVSAQFSEQLSGWAKAGMVTGESLPFMLEMALNPLSGLGEAAQKGLVKYAIKRYGTKWVRDHIKSVTAGKLLTRGIADIAGAYGMATTTGAARTAADAVRRATGQVEIGQADNGDVIFNGVKLDTKEDPITAIFHGLNSTAVENWSEMAGNYLGFLSDFFGKVIGKSVIGKEGRNMLAATGSLEGVSLNKAQKFIYELAAGKGIGAFSEGLAQFAKKTQWHGVFNEYLEEVMGNIVSATPLVGDMTFDTAKDTGVFNLEQNIDTFCGVALMGGFMSALHTGGFIGHKINYNPDLVSNENSKLFGDEAWNDIKTMIDNSYLDPREMNNALTYLLRGTAEETNKPLYNDKEKKAILKYAQAVLEKEGREMANYHPRMESSKREEVTGEGGEKQWQVTSLDMYGNPITQQAFDTEDEAKAFEGELKMQQQKQDLDDFMSMSTKLSFTEASNAIDEFLGTMGITPESENYDEAVASLNDPNSELGQQFQGYKYNKVIEKARASQAAIAAFEEQMGWTPGTVKWLSEQDPMQLDEEGLQMQDQARDFLETLAYPSNEVHVEHEAKKGAETGKAVVENVVSPEESIDPNNNAGKEILDQWNAAQANLEAAFAKNEDLKTEVESMEAAQLSPQEIVSSLTTFKPEEVQTVIDYYNAKAKYDGMLNAAANKINEEAANSRQRHTFKGTIDGEADLNNVHTITDGTNRYYLVSGNVTTNPATGQITGSTSGLIIGMDLDGSFVQLNESDGYSTEPISMTLDQFEEAERIRLQEAVTTVVDPNQAMNPNIQQTESAGTEQSGNLDNAGGEAVVNNDNGANNPPATAPTTSGGENATKMQGATIESVTDKDGIKRYENGISAEDAVADMVASGDNPIEVADASIAEADLAIKKINEKPTKTRKDLEDRKKHQKVKDYYEDIKNRYVHEDRADGTSYTQIGDRAILSKDGKIIYDTAGILGPVFPEGEATGAVANGEGNLNIGGEQPQNEGNVVPSQPKLTVEEQKQERIKALKAELGELFDDDFTKANDVYELVSMWVGRKRNLAWDDVNGKRGLQKELGWTRKIGGDTKYIETLLAKKGEGMGVDEFVHMVWESPENTVGEEKRWSTEEIKEALLDLLKSAASKSDVVDYALNTREAQARQALAEQQQQAEADAAQGETEITLTDEEIAQMEANLPFAMPIDEDIPDSPIVQLMKAIEALRQRDGMPEIKLVDTDRMSDDEWYDIASAMFDGAFVSQEEIETAQQVVFESGVFYNPETGVITVYSDSQKAEEVTNKVNKIYEEITRIDSVPEEGRDNGGDTIVSGNGQEASAVEEGEGQQENQSPIQGVVDSEAAEGESSASAEPVTDNYLQPRDAEEEKIVADVLAQLQQEIQGAIDEQNKARSELQKAQARESERATDMFSDDEAFEEPGQLFSFDDMGGTDRSQEGVERRTAAERQRLQQATDKLNQLQSEQERNSRIRGALDNHRRQTQIDLGTEPQGTVAQSREEYLASHPLTEEQIMADTEATEDEKLNAIDFLRGEDDSAISRFYYDSIYNRVAAQPQQTEQKPLEPITDPMEAIEDAANLFRGEQETINKRKERWQGKREEQKSQDQADIDAALKEFDDFLDNAKGSGILDKFMRKGLEGNDKAQANLLDAFTLTNEAQRMFLKDLLRLASKVGYAYIKSGIHDAQAWSKKMSETIGRKLNEVLGWDDAIVGEFVDEVWNQKYTVDGQRMRLSEHADRLKNDKGADTAVNVNKQEDNEPKNVVSSQQKPASELEGDSAEFADRQEKEKALRDDLKQELLHGVSGDRTLKTMQDVKKLAEKHGLDMSLTDLQEIVEAVIVDMARTYANSSFLTDKQKFDNIVALYQTQPTLSARDNDRINKQQYSTPAPMAFLMGKFLTSGKEVKSGLEPSAGNGMLTIGLPKESMHVNDIDEMRLSNLQKQGFGQVTSQDGLQSFGEKQYDVVVTNPPFGNVPSKTYDGLYEISGLEHQMAINALESMKDDGRAAIIIGGNTDYNQNGTIKGKDRAFLNYLYAHYNVVDVINMNGHELYSRQGTGFPVRMILINGRKEFNPRSFAPVIQKARAERVNSYDELYKRVNDDILSDTNKPASVHDTKSGESRRVDDTSNAGNTTQTGVRNVRTEGGSEQHPVLDRRGQSVQGSPGRTEEGTNTGGREQLGEGDNVVLGTGQETTKSSGVTTSQTDEGRGISERRDGAERPNGGVDVPVGAGQRGAGTSQQTEQPAVKRGLGTEKVPYRKQSGNPFTLQSLMPAEQAEVVKKSLEELGDVDQYLVDELGYSSKEELHQALAAEQIDSVAMAIHQMNQGSAFIIGDQTGIGKGRQAAALIRYGVKKGGFPVFITVKKGLFSDMYRDLCDIGSPGLRPFIWSADDTEHSADVTDKNGNVVYKRPSDKEQKRVVDYINKHGKLPPEYDYIITTYDSFKGGTMVYEEGQKKARNFGKKKPTTGAYNSQAKRDALEVLAQNSFVIMDESHNAGGEGSAVSGYLQYITTRAKGVTFLSATFAKRPGNMPIYSLKTAIAKAGVKIEELIDAVKRGGATFQEIMSKALTEAGQMIRRERDMTGVTIDWKGIEDEEVVQRQREQYDTIIGLFNDIIDFQRRYVDPIVNKKNDDAAEEQGEVDHTPGTRDMGINNTPFASRTYNMVQQVLLSLKAEETARRAIEHLKQGHKPVIALANTNEGAADEVSTGEDMEMPDLSVNLKKGLQGTLRITKKDAFGNSTNEMIPFDELSEAGQARYQEIMDAIENASSGLSLSPIDVIKNELKKAGYKVGELTGRKQEFVYNEDGTVKRVKRQDSDKKRTAADFNNGKLDVLILNKSAGTGISLHASSKFDDQRQRVMIVAQAQGDVNDEVQIRGRIDRTGQVLRGMYEYVVSQIPSEQRLLMMLKAKLRSLDANTTSSQKSKFNEMQVQDIINKYGDDIVIQYLAEHPDLAAKMVDPLKWNNKLGDSWESMPSETLIANADKDGEAGKTASKVLGRMALLKVAEQEKMLAEIGDMYQAEIDRLNEMGENDLEITEMPLKAKTLKKSVWEQGVEPGGKNPFADNSYVETVEMDVLKKPMKGEEVKKAQERLLGGKTWEEYKQAQLDKVDKWAEDKKAETRKTFTERAEKKAEAEKEKYIKGAKKAQEKNGMTDEEIEKNGGYQYDTFYKQEMEKLDNALAAIDKQKQTFVDALETFSTDGVYALPTDIYDLSQLTFEPSFGKVIDIKITDNFSTNASTITFATLDGRRKITIPINGMVKQNNGEKQNIVPSIVQQTAQSRSGFFGSNIANTLKVLEQNVDNWDKLTSNATRKQGYIITGNLLKALTSLRSQGKGGKLISYTTDTGEIRQGILMSDKFDASTLTSQNPISSKKGELKVDDDKVESADGEVTIKVTGSYDWRTKEYPILEIIVPKSNKRGSKYFNDETLLSLMRGQFEGSSRMRATFYRENLDAVMKRLDELGVTVAEEHKDESTNTQLSSDPMDAINQAAESWRKEHASDIAKQIYDLPKKHGLKGAAITQVIGSREELEALKGKIDDKAYKAVEKAYNNPKTDAVYVPRLQMVVIFGEKIRNPKHAESTWWHEQTHHFWHSLPEDVRQKYSVAIWEYMGKHYPEKVKEIQSHYSPGEWYNEGCSYFIGEVIKQYGTENFLSLPFEGIEEICNFATELRNFIKNEKGRKEEGYPIRQQSAGIERGSGLSGRSDLRERGDEQGGSVEEEVNQQISDPLEAIRNAAESWRKERKERIEGVKDLGEYSAKKVYHERLNHATTMIQEAWQDDMIAFKHGQNAIAHDKDIPDSQNAYQAANLAFGRIYNQQEQFTDIYRKPLEETIYQVCERMGWQTGDVDRYVFTKHGFERNRELFVRDWMQAERKKEATYEMLDDERQEAYDKIMERLEEQVDDGTITEEQRDKKLEQALKKLWQEQLDKLQQDYVDAKEEAYQKLMKGEINFAEFVQAIDDFIHDNIDKDFNAESNDCSGFTEMFGKGYKEKDILDQLMADEEKMGKDLMDKMWSQINLCSQLGLDKYRESGMISEDTYKRITNMFHFYVPMRGFGNETSAQDHWQYMTVKDGAATIGGLLKKAGGRKSEANYPLSTLFAMTYKAISDGEQNMVKQKFYRLCQANPNDLVTIQDTWAVLDNTTGEWVIDYPNINEDMSPQEVEARTREFYERMDRLQAEGKAKKVKSKAKFDYKVDKKRHKEHVVEVSINGDRKTMIIKGNPRMAQALNGNLRYERGSGKWNEMVANMKQFQQTVSTSYNLTFVGRNMARDWTHFGAILQAREGAGYEKAAQKYYWSQIPHMVSLFSKYRKGTLDMSNEMERDFKDFMDNGGITGFVHMQKVEELQKEMEKLLSTPGKVKKVGSAFWDKTLGAVQAMNEAIENNARFATYRASRHYAGRTKARSAYDAKEVTVNFNKRGAGKKTSGFKTDKKWVHRAAVIAGETSQILQANKMFFNATVQAICNIFRNIRNADGTINKKYVERLVGYYAIPPFAMGLLMPVINQALYALAGGDDGDDPYANLPEWVRRKNLCIYTGWIPGCGKNDFLVIPIGQELAAFYSMGDMMAGTTYRPNLKPVDKDIVDEMIGFFNVFSPVDFETQITSGDRFAPVSEVVGRICSPAAPLVAVGENMAWMGRPIYREDRFQGDEYTPEYQMTLGNTNSAYISLSKWLNDVSGGDDVKRGWAQINPGAMQYVFEQYVGGPGKFFMNTGSALGDAYKAAFTDDEHDFNIRKIEFVRAFWQQGDERTELYRAKAKYRKYREDANEYYHNLKGYSDDALTNPDHYMKAREMSKGKDFVRMNMVREADKYLKKLNTAANQAEGKNRKNLRALYNNALAGVVNELDKVQDIE